MDLKENDFMRKISIEHPGCADAQSRGHALHRRQALGDAIVQLLELGIAAFDIKNGTTASVPRPVILKGVGLPTIDDTKRAIGTEQN